MNRSGLIARASSAALKSATFSSTNVARRPPSSIAALGDVDRVLVGAGQEARVVAAHPVPARDHVRPDHLVQGVEAGLVVRVRDGRGQVVAVALGHGSAMVAARRRAFDLWCPAATPGAAGRTGVWATADSTRRSSCPLPAAVRRPTGAMTLASHARHAIRNRLSPSMGAERAAGRVSMTAFVFVVASGTIRPLADETATLEGMEDAVPRSRRSRSFTQETFVFDYALSDRQEALDEFDAATAGRLPWRMPTLAGCRPYPGVAGSREAVHVPRSPGARSGRSRSSARSARADGRDGAETVEASEVLFLPAEEA